MNKFFSKHWLYFLLAGGGVLLLFILFSFFVHKNLFTSFDFDMTVRLQDHLSRRFDNPLSLLSDVGTFEVVTVLLLILLVVRRRLMAIFVLFFYGSLHLMEIYGKTFVSHLPPPEFMLRTQHVIQYPQFYVRLENSYPSGHEARALFLTSLLGILVWRSKRISQTLKVLILIGLALYDIAMGISRIYLGEHWTSDVIGGAILGLATGLLASIFL